MSFIAVAIFSYFLTAGAAVLDKFLIAGKKINHPAVYTFFVGFLSIATLAIFFPFGFHTVAPGAAFSMFLFGAIYAYGLLSLFFSFRSGEASRIVPVVGVATSLTSFFISYIFLGDSLSLIKILGIFLLLIGGMIISLEPSKNKSIVTFSELPLAILSGAFLGIAFSSFKFFYSSDNFINVFIWTRIGVFLGALSLLLVAPWRKAVIRSFRGFGKDKKGNARIGVIFVSNKILGGLGSIIFNLAISLGSVAVANALVATEYAFVFILSVMLSGKFPKIFKDKINSGAAIQKIAGILIIGVGILLVK